MKKTYYSNGKLLITGEYVVLDGAKAFALPTKFGQNLIVEEGKNHEINWTSYDKDGSIWFQEVISFAAISTNTKFENQSVKNTLIEILHEGFLLNPDFLKSKGYTITTQLSFPKFWGLGTSSTLINNIAQWLEIDAFKLLKNSFGGSGYDIACAQNNSPILFKLKNDKPIVETVNFNPDFSDHLYFVYLNQKQSSKEAIASYIEKKGELVNVISALDKITTAVLSADKLEDFAALLEEHENILSEVLETKTVKETLFSDFNGSVKSLGAWGGDFVLAISKENPAAYFKAKGFETVVPYKEMILE